MLFINTDCMVFSKAAKGKTMETGANEKDTKLNTLWYSRLYNVGDF